VPTLDVLDTRITTAGVSRHDAGGQGGIVAISTILAHSGAPFCDKCDDMSELNALNALLAGDFTCSFRFEVCALVGTGLMETVTVTIGDGAWIWAFVYHSSGHAPHQ
jgi:hypothetical protein